MNIAHPFREGGGRSTRIRLDMIFRKELGPVVDGSLVDKEDDLLAMERSPVRDTEIKVLKKAITLQPLYEIVLNYFYSYDILVSNQSLYTEGSYEN